MTQGNIAAVIVVGCLVGMFGMREIAHHRPLPLKPLPLCEEVGNAIEALPPMIHRDAVDPPTPEEAIQVGSSNGKTAVSKTEVAGSNPAPPAKPKRHKKPSRPQTHVVPAPPPPPPEPGPPEHFGALDWFFDWLKSWGKHD